MKSLYITFFIVVLDQITKLIIKGVNIPFLGIQHTGMAHGRSIPVLGEFFHITFVENPGMAFSIDVNETAKVWVSVFSIIAVIGLIYYLYSVRKQSFSLRLALAFILGGAIGNLIDRVLYGVFFQYAPLFHGKVVDFLDFDFFDMTLFGRSYQRFPIFNVADSAVTIGVLILLIFYNKHQREVEQMSVAGSEAVSVQELESAGVESESAKAESETMPEEEQKTEPGEDSVGDRTETAEKQG